MFLSEWIWARLWRGGCKLVLQVSKRGKISSSLLSAWISALVNRQAVFLACSILSHLKAHLSLGMLLSQMRNERETCPHFLSCPLRPISPPSSPLSPAVLLWQESVLLWVRCLLSHLSSLHMGAVSNYPQCEMDTVNSVRLPVSIWPSVDSSLAPSLSGPSGQLRRVC